MTREKILSLLRQAGEDYLSGEQIAASLGLSRAAVWKGIDRLRARGYRIESAPGRGYRLGADNDALSEEGVRRYLRHALPPLQVYTSIGSTNTRLKALAEEGAPEGTVLIAGEQTAGRGRLGRSFYSPAGTGLYMSLLLRPALPAAQATGITACAAVAAAEAIEELSGRKTQIKWVNDVLLEGRKICGILTEASLNWESGLVDYAVLGIGINTRVPAQGFPEELREIAGAAFDRQLPELRCRLAAAVLDRFLDQYEHLAEGRFYEAYRDRSAVLGREIRVLRPGAEPRPALALDIGRDFSLRVRYPDGSEEELRSGEISVRAEQG